jgi:hypothetical protein
MGKKPNTDTDGLVWQPVALSIGGKGLDLRRPGEPGTLTELLNAKFLDGKTVARRDGHLGQLIQDNSAFRLDKQTTNEWVYGHGTRIIISASTAAGPLYENARHPVHKRGGGIFEHEDTDVAWTGDRLLIVTDGGPFYGSDSHWNRTV